MNINKKPPFVFLVLSIISLFSIYAQEVIRVVDPHIAEIVLYSHVEEFADGSKMTEDKCDDVIFIKKDKKFYRRIFTGPINIKWFGAKGDGNINDIGTDDTYAIKKAINSLAKIYKSEAMSGGNIYGGFSLYFPPGFYIINETLILPDGISIIGDSYVNTVIHTKQPRFIFTNVRGMSINGIDVLMSTDLKISNITLKQGGIEFQGASNSLIENVRIMNLFGGNNFDTGVLIKLPVNLKLRDLKIFGSTGAGIKYEDTAGTGPSTSTTLDNVWVSHCKVGMIVDGNVGGSHGILTSRIYNSIFEYNETGIIFKGNIENFVIRDIHLEQNKSAIEINGNVNMVLENIWSDKGYLTLKNSSKINNSKALYLRNVNITQKIDKSFKGKIINY